MSAGWLGYLVFHQGTLSARFVSNIGLITAALTAAFSCAATARRKQGGERRAWALFAGSAASWGLGQTGWTVYETLLGRTVPFPSLADIGYLGAVPLAVAALLSMPGPARSRASRVRLVVDGLVTASSLMVVSWALVLGPVFASDGLALLPQVISLAYPVGDVVLITMALSFASYFRRPNQLPVPTLLLICGALLSLAVADSGFSYLTTKEIYSSGHPIDAGWFIGYGLLFLASRYRHLPVDHPAAETPRRAPAATPYIAVLCAIGAAGALQVLRGTIGAFVVWDLVVTMLLLVARQYLSIMENHALARTLEERVRVRTEEVRKNEERFRALVQNSSDVVTILEVDGSIRYQSPSVERVFGYPPDMMLGAAFADLVHPDDTGLVFDAIAATRGREGATALVEVGVLHRDGRWCRSETAVTNLLAEPSIKGLVLNTRDVSERKRLEDQLVHQAFHDPLTGLANASLFRDRISHALAQRHQRRRSLAVLFCDLDGFKRVNDSLGHASGDLLLKAVGDRLASVVRPGDTVARLGGDEFAVLLE
ncbi:MAG: diguanylate cyclase domain-containing protein, partial [Acidimicrobiales bacterium]